MPLAFFCTLFFFRHRKKSVSAPWDGQSQFAPESARQAPPRGFAYGKVVAYRCKQGAFRSPPAPLRIATRSDRAPLGTASPNPRRSRRVKPRQGELLTAKLLPIDAMQGGFPRGKQSARPALPCAPLVVCLNSGSLTAFGGCIHWIPASLRSPPAPPSGSRRTNGAGVCACGRTKGLSSTQTISAARTTVRTAPIFPYSTVTLLARFLGLSTSQPR